MNSLEVQLVHLQTDFQQESMIVLYLENKLPQSGLLDPT